MKKFTVLFVGIMIFTVITASAQLSVAPKIGINFANLGGDISVNKVRLRTQIGGVVNFEIDEMFSVQPGLLLSGKGATLEYSDGDVDAIALTYLEVPLNGVLNLETDAGMVQIFAGPYLAICAGAKAKYLADDDNASESYTIGTSENDDFKPFDFGFNIGIGFLHEENIQAQLGYGGSLTDIWNYDDDKLKNSIISLTIAYFLNWIYNEYSTPTDLY